MEFPSPPRRKERVYVPEGLHVKMCLCGTPCRLLKSTKLGYTYGGRYWMCANYEFDPPHDSLSSNIWRVIHISHNLSRLTLTLASTNVPCYLSFHTISPTST